MDSINSMFEFTGGFFILFNCIKLHKDKQIKGVSFVPVIFFTMWGLWNPIYYSSISQWYSTVGSICTTLVNAVWLSQMFYYWRKERGRKELLYCR